MVAYNFKRQFAADVEALIKLQTIRAEREPPARHALPGEPVQLYVDQRLPGCRKLVDPDPICISVEPIIIEPLIQLPLPYGEPAEIFTRVILGATILLTPEIEQLARDDGFDCFESMRKFFQETHGLPFEGFLIKWKPNA